MNGSVEGSVQEAGRWGCLVGGITGGLIIWMDILDVSGGVSTAALGIGFLVYYGIMGLICYKLDR